jgi:hypothetical protein
MQGFLSSSISQTRWHYLGERSTSPTELAMIKKMNGNRIDTIPIMAKGSLKGLSPFLSLSEDQYSSGSSSLFNPLFDESLSFESEAHGRYR